MSFKEIQNKKINGKDFVFTDPANVTYPVAPLVSANFFTPAGEDLSLKIRTTLYINTDTNNKPRIVSVNEEDGVLTIIYRHSFTDTTPETCDVWYVEVDYTSDTVKNINQIISYLDGDKNAAFKGLGDPTSRGTRTEPDL